MNHDVLRAWHMEELAGVREKRDTLPPDSPVRQTLTDEFLQRIEDKILGAAQGNLDYTFWPPLFGYVANKSRADIAALDADIRLVNQHTATGKAPIIPQFLKTAAEKRHGEWYGGLFDLWAKATIARSGNPFELDCALSNGRDNDARFQLNGKGFRVECTVLTQDDESEGVWKRFLDDKRLDPSRVLIRPGPYCPPDARGPSPYYTTFRFYAKVFDKLTKDLNPARSQCSDDEPNLLLVSFGPGVHPDAPGVGWALDELFAAQPRSARAVVPESLTDISLDAWVHFRAEELVNSRRMRSEWFCDHSHEIFAAPRMLGAVLLFKGNELERSRINYNARDACSITHREMADIEQMFNKGGTYWM